MSIKLVNVQELFGKTFVIPYYQRGYRWTERQIEDILKDILDFQRKPNKPVGEFYCLQPIVVKKIKENEYEVIDGQQRLTTLYLLLKYFQDIIKIVFNENLAKSENWFQLKYETRNNFVDDFQNNQNNNIIDSFYIQKAWDFLNNWINTHSQNQSLNKSDYLNTILKQDIRRENNIEKDIANNIRFIWYEIEGGEIGEKIFTRLNCGKIPLTNAELIKALFFINNNHVRANYQFEKAYEWELIENRLQNDSFWYFLNKQENTTPTRIEFIFDLIADKYKDKVSIKVDKSIDKYFSFYIFNEIIINKININGEGQLNDEQETRDMLWCKVKEYFRLFEEWFNDYEYYHLIGYLIHTQKGIGDLIELYSNKSKTEFKRELINQTKKDILGNQSVQHFTDN